MEVTTINAELFARMFLAGANNLEAKKEWINELNVFPVPDGDTGTNMSMTIMSAAKEVAAIENPTMASLAKAISSGSLRGARGNSVPAEIRVSSFPSFFADSQKRSVNMMRLIHPFSQEHVSVRQPLHIRQL